MRHILIATTALVLTACGERADTANSGSTTGSTAGTSAETAGNATDTSQTAQANANMQGMAAEGTAAQNGMDSAVSADNGRGSGMQGDTAAGDAMAGGAAAGNSPEAYVSNAAISDMYERESSQLALTAASSTAVKTFARQMIADHTATTAEVKKIVSSSNIDIKPPAQLDSRRQGLIDSLRKAAPADFDRIYVQQQTAAHREALALHKGFADAGTNAPLKAFAAKTAPKVQMHLEMVEKMAATG